MKFQGAVVEEQGIRFAIVKVSSDTFDIPGRARDKMVSFQRLFPNMAVVFMAEESGKAPNFYGRPDVVRVMMGTDMDGISWQEYTLDETESS